MKDKNIAPFGDSNLLVHKIRQLKKVPSIDRIVVSSDSDEYLAMAKAEGVLAHKRDREYCIEGEGQTKSFGEVVRHIAESVEGEHIVWCQPTSPLVTRLPGVAAFLVINRMRGLSAFVSLSAVRNTLR